MPREWNLMTTILATTRMRMREYTDGDLETLAAMVTDEQQMRFYPRPKIRDEASAWVNRNLSLYREHGFGFWFMESIETAEFLGYCGIRPHDALAEIEMGWHTRKKFWNQGLATEAALACRDIAFNRFGLQRLIAIIEPRNVSSLRVAEKVGMRPERKTVLDDYPCVIYVVERPQRPSRSEVAARRTRNDRGRVTPARRPRTSMDVPPSTTGFSQRSHLHQRADQAGDGSHPIEPLCPAPAQVRLRPH